jgi:hypothetical protein
MTLSLYLLCGIPWTIYATCFQVRVFGIRAWGRLIATFVLNLVLWPIAPLLAVLWN